MRTIPITHNGGLTDSLSWQDVEAPPWSPPDQPERVSLSHHIEPPDPIEARAWAGAAAIGGGMVAIAVDAVAIYGGAVTGWWIAAGWVAIGAWLIPPVAYLTPYVIRFKLRHQFDTRVRSAMPPPRPYVEAKGRAVIEGRVVSVDNDPDRDAHLHKLYTLALWAASEERDEDGAITKEYGAAPVLRRDGKGKCKRRELPVAATGDVIHQEDQVILNRELAAVQIFKQHSWGWGLFDTTWTYDEVVSRMEAAFPDE